MYPKAAVLFFLSSFFYGGWLSPFVRNENVFCFGAKTYSFSILQTFGVIDLIFRVVCLFVNVRKYPPSRAEAKKKGGGGSQYSL